MSDSFLDKFVLDLIAGVSPKVKVEQEKCASVSDSYELGVKQACEQFNVKEAFLGLLGSLGGGAALRSGLGMLGSRAGGSTLGRMANKALSGGKMMNMGLDMAGSMAGGALGSKLQGQQQQPPPMGT